MHIDSDPIGVGIERACYVHPRDPDKAVKVSIKRRTLQSEREIRYYSELIKRPELTFEHLPRFYGTVKTNIGDGFIVDLVRDHDGQVSKPLNWYLANGFAIEKLQPYLDDLKEYLLQHLIIFNYDMKSSNLLLQKLTPRDARLIVIDGIGDTVYIQWFNLFKSHVKSKINRRWKRFIERLYRSREVKAQLDKQD